MKLNNHRYHRREGQSQALHNVSFFNNLPEPSLWNSQIGRREFLGKVGKASVGTAIALNGLKLEVMASGSGGPDPRSTNETSSGTGVDATHFKVTTFKFKVKNNGTKTAVGTVKVKAYDLGPYSGGGPFLRFTSPQPVATVSLAAGATSQEIVAVQEVLTIVVSENPLQTLAAVASYKIIFTHSSSGIEEEIGSGEIDNLP